MDGNVRSRRHYSTHFAREAVAIAASVGLYIGAAYWFTASTSFANPAVTVARAISNTFAGIRPEDVPLFVIAQVIGALSGAAVAAVLLPRQESP